KTLSLYVITTVMAVSLGLVLVNAIKPGNKIDEELQTVNRLSYEMWAADNGVKVKDGKHYLHNPIYEGYLKDARAKLATEGAEAGLDEKIKAAGSQKGKGPLQFVVDMVPSNIFISFTDNLMLQVIFFAIFFGVTMISLPRDKVAGV